MATATLNAVDTATAFPSETVKERLRQELGDAARESEILRGTWDPMLDSLRVVSVLVSLEDLFDFPIPPEQVVRRGGYSSVDEGVVDVSGNLQRLWDDHHKPKDRL